MDEQSTNSAKPLVKSLTDGVWSDFQDSERNVLAQWSAMVNINLECYSRILTTTQHQRTILSKGLMPPGWRVSIAQMSDKTCAGDSFHRAFQTSILASKNEYIRLQSTYFCIEQIAFHNLSALGDRILELGLLAIGVSEIRLPMSLIWPKNELTKEKKNVLLNREDLINIQNLFR